LVREKKDYKRIVLNIPTKQAATLEYLVSIAQLARTKSDLIVQMVNDFVDKKRDVLNDSKNWNDFSNAMDNKNNSKLEKLLAIFDDDEEDEEDED